MPGCRGRWPDVRAAGSSQGRLAVDHLLITPGGNMPVVYTFRTAVHTAMVATLVTVAVATAAGDLTGVPQANPKIPGTSVPTVLSPQLRQFIVAQGSIPLENGTPDFPLYGYNGDGLMV